MGRINNAISIRLGNNLLWINNGIYIKKIKCVRYIHFIKNIIDLINIKGHKNNYLISKIQLFQEKFNLIINIYFYKKKINIFGFNKYKLSRKLKKLKIFKKVKKINKLKFLEKYSRIINDIYKKKKKSKKINLKKKKINKFRYKKKKINKFIYLKKKKKKLIFKKRKFKFYRRKRRKLYDYIPYILKKKFLKYCYRNRLLKLKLYRYEKRNNYIFNNIFNEKKLKKKRLINYNFIIIYKKDLKNILYRYIKKNINILKKNNKKVFKKKRLKKINKLLNKKFNNSKKLYKLKENLLKLIIKYNNKIDLLKINKIFFYKGLNNFLITPRILVIKKKLSLINLRKKKKKTIKLLKFLLLRKLIKNKLLKNKLKKKKLYIYNYYIKYINLKGKKYKKIYKYTYKEIIYYKYNNYKYKKKEKTQLKYILNKVFLLNILQTERLILLAGKNYLNHDIIFNYFLVGNFNYTSELLSKYICIKLKQRFTLNQVIKPLTKYLKKLIKKKNLFGYRIKLSGRFTRKQRATSIIIKFGTVPLATISKQIDYAQSDVILKDGKGSVKVWLNKTTKFKNSIISFKSL